MRFLYPRGNTLQGIRAYKANESPEPERTKACRSMSGFSKIMGMTHERTHEKTCN